MTWSAAQYVKFEQSAPGPFAISFSNFRCARRERRRYWLRSGQFDRSPARALPETRIVGVNSSPDMIEAARKRLPGVAFEVADIRAWRPKGPLDAILANAVLQWIPDHETLIPALIGALEPGGVLAAQMPDNLDEPSHRLMREIAAEGPWAAKLKDAANARRAPRRRVVFPPAAFSCAPCRHLAHHLLSPA